MKDRNLVIPVTSTSERDYFRTRAAARLLVPLVVEELTARMSPDQTQRIFEKHAALQSAQHDLRDTLHDVKNELFP